ncbi:MAG: YihY/virulence factor BrkB family protein [Phycisphaerales bacterium]
MKLLNETRQSVHRLLTEPVDELSRAQRSLRYMLDFGRYCARELRADRAGEMAAALTYHTLFSLLPTIVIMLVILQTFVGETDRENLKQNVVDFALQWVKPDESETTSNQALLWQGPVRQGEIQPPEESNALARDTRGEYEDARRTLTKNVQSLIDKLEQINFASIGIVGVLIFIYASTKLLSTAEHNFNRIFDAPYGRPIYVRLPLYWTSITFAPLLLLAGQFVQNRIITFIEDAAAAAGTSAGWLGGFTALITPFVTTWLVLTLMYQFLPNAKVSTRAALTGGFIAALCWTVLIEGFKVYVRIAGTANLYGALALLPLFLLWLWVTWLFVLFGLEVTYTIQMMKGRRFKSLRTAEDRDVLFDPRWMIPLTAIIGRSFQNGRAIRFNELQVATGLPNRAVANLVDILTEGNVIHHVEHGEPGVPAYALARPPEKINIDELLDLSEKAAMRERNRAQLSGVQLVADLHDAQLNAAKGKTLADVMDEGE